MAIALIVFTGGPDVSPDMYNRTSHSSTFVDIERDLQEVNLFNIALDNNIPMAGICRGAQLLCVMAGGTLVQDVTGHNSNHIVKSLWPKKNIIADIEVTSSHHQMQCLVGLPKEDYKILAWSPRPFSKHYALDHKTTVLVDKACSEFKFEPDVVWYPKIKALAAQYHPEWMQENTAGFRYFEHLVDYYLAPLVKNNETNRKREAASSATS